MIDSQQKFFSRIPQGCGDPSQPGVYSSDANPAPSSIPIVVVIGNEYGICLASAAPQPPSVDTNDQRSRGYRADILRGNLARFLRFRVIGVLQDIARLWMQSSGPFSHLVPESGVS
jgi:hypothetical protein